MVFITGDTHADFSRFNTRYFPEQKEMHRSDTVIVLGDFGGVWYDSAKERHRLDWLSKKPYTTCFIDGNHENFDRLYGDEFQTVEFHGGVARKIRNGVYYIPRGQVLDFEGKKFFCFGGARSHDIRDGILDPSDFDSTDAFNREYTHWMFAGKQFRINHLSWWERELPDDAEMDRARKALKKHRYKVDYVIAHCLPTSIASAYSGGFYEPDVLTDFFDSLLSDGLRFKEWHCGHYHKRDRAYGQYFIHYGDIFRLL